MWLIFSILTIGVSCFSYVSGACPTMEVLEGQEQYIQGDITCEDEVYQIRVYEDCPKGILVLQLNDDEATIQDCDGELFVNDTQFGFNRVDDMENRPNSQTFFCVGVIVLSHGGEFDINIEFIDVDEFLPVPSNGSITQSVHINENTAGFLFKFGYEDPDFGEIETIEYNFLEDGDGSFSLVKLRLIDEVQFFGLIADIILDFETLAFYELEIVFTTFDDRLNSSSTTQTFFIFVEDVGDTNPIFISPCPYEEIPETNDTVSICTVVARDGDLVVNNAIKYSIDSFTPEFGSDYFDIDETTGEIFTYAPIDRESLSATNFAIIVVATEYLENGSVAPQPNSISQTTNIYITDVNDNKPVFDEPQYEADMNEFNQETNSTSAQKRLTNLTILVTDLDAGPAGSYVVTSNYEKSIILNPASGFGITNVSVTVINEEKIFDYEAGIPDQTITVIITATEEENSTHISTTELLIHLQDINDNTPTFDEGNYETSCDENTKPGTSIADVSAHDDDASIKFNNIIYSISAQQDCGNFLVIDPLTGEIRVAENATLDYEQRQTINCMLTASDENVLNPFSLQNEVPFVLNLNDIDDVQPTFVMFESSLNVSEDVEKGEVLTVINVIDVDSDASLIVTMSFPDNPGQEVESWFSLEISEDSTPSNYIGNLLVENKLDREALSGDSDEVIIEFTAEDVNGIDLQEEKRTLTLLILDVNDEYPTFDKNYSSVSYDENTEVDTVVVVIKAIDTDLDDEISFSISNNFYVEIMDSSIGNISVRIPIDREKHDEFTATVTISDLVNHINSIEITFTINDLNDNPPIFDDSCSEDQEVSEDEDDGYEVVTVSATDQDIGVHGQISYVLQNANSVENNAPFAIDIDTGIITVDNSSGLLDREAYSQWVLIIEAVDGCEEDELGCQTNRPTCYMTVNILDVNDESPDSYRLSTGDDTIFTDEDLREDEEISHLFISATDLDEEDTNNSEINFEAIALFKLHERNEETLVQVEQLFKTNNSNFENSCTLIATKNLTHLRGDYVITIMGTDSGEPPLSSNHNFSLLIRDRNDYAPHVSYSNCLENDKYTITILENDAAVCKALNCSSNEEAATIFVIDLDEPNTDNSDVYLRINVDLSQSIDGAEDNQLTNFEIFDYGDNVRFGIQLNNNSVIDREKGSSYQLVISALDQGTPQPLETYFTIHITIDDVNEFPPIFCDEVTNCEPQTLSTLENSVNPIDFRAASDKDNINGDGTYVTNDEIYYYIIQYDGVKAFSIPDHKINNLVPIIALDRENTSQYSFTIMASNYEIDQSPSNTQLNQILRVVVNILDENDVSPHFNETIFGAYMKNGHKGDPVALLEFYDEDYNDTLTYTIGNDIVWDPVQQNFDDPFKIVPNDSRRSEIILNMDPTGSIGQCSFTIYCNDANPEHDAASTMVQVFVITDEYIVPFFFRNDIVTVNGLIDQIADILSDVFGYICQIDAISQATDSNNEEIAGETVVYAHFIDVIENESEENESKSGKSSRRTFNRRSNSVETKRNRKKIHNRNDDVFFSTSRYFDSGNIGDSIETNELEAKSLVEEKDFGGRNKSNLSILENENILIQKEAVLKSPIDVHLNVSTYEKKFPSSGTQYQLVPEQEIEDLSTDGVIANELITDFENIGLDLIQIGETETTGDSKNYEQTIVTLKIVIGAVCLGLGLLLLLLILGYWHKTTKLERQLKAMSVKTYGSKSSGLNKIGMGMDVPGTNMYKANPILNLVEVTPKHQDTGSIGSGDSIFTGVEDNPEFRDYIESRRVLSEIDESEVDIMGNQEDRPTSSAYLPSAENVTQRQNPLIASFKDTDPDGFQITYGKSRSIAEEPDVDVIDNQLNSNFSFS